ncbi:Ribonuclease 3 [bacterium HR40]|nr:Ribonuclease 3 [bacterium HR40]
MPPSRGDASEARLAALEQALGHRFRDRSLLIEALTHASAAGPGRPSNERLEFLGDRVLGLVVARLLIEAFPQDPEGALGKRLAHLVDRRTLARIAQELPIRDAIRMSRGEECSGGRDNPGILADCLEALIAALFLDGGLQTAEAFVRRHWHERIAKLVEPPRDPKTALQEWAQGHGLPRPEYQLLDIAGPPHAPAFRVQASLPGFPPTVATGPSRRRAEQQAAAQLLAMIRNARP